MKERYELPTLRRSSLALLGQIEPIIADYHNDGYDVTVRQLYYRLVGLGILKTNDLKTYKSLVGLLTKARMAGLLDWSSFVDRHRRRLGNAHWDDPGQYLRDAADDFAIDKWANQPNYVEVMVEKDALAGILSNACYDLDVTLTPNKGYSSSSFFYNAGKRYAKQLALGKEVHILYLGDHDPSGIDMSRDMVRRLELFAGRPMLGTDGPWPEALNIHRVALNYDQVQELNPPENFAKSTDDRTPAYVKQFGDKCWELDAVEPRALDKILRDKILSLRDEDLWAEALDDEANRRDLLVRFAGRYSKWETRELKRRRK